MKTAFIWNIPTRTKPLEYGAYIGTHILAAMCHYDAVTWANNEPMNPAIHDYDCVIVSLFGDMPHITQIKAAHPDCYVIALPDSYFNELFVNYSEWDMNFLQQMQAADCIGYVSESNRQFYCAMFPQKPAVRIPMPIGHDDYFAGIREQDKEDYIITCDHPSITGARTIDYSIQNVAALAQIQRYTGMRVVYVNCAAKTRHYAEIAGLQATFAGYIDFETYARLSACARIGVDMYALHGFGRNTLMWAYAGTPAIGSSYNDFNMLACDPWMADDASQTIKLLLGEMGAYSSVRERGIQRVIDNHSAAACTRQLTELLERVDQWRHSPVPN